MVLAFVTGQKQRYCFNPTIEDVYTNKIKLYGLSIEIIIHDISGLAEYQPLRQSSYSKFDVILVTAAIDRPNYFRPDLLRWRQEITTFCTMGAVPIVLVGSKSDTRVTGEAVPKAISRDEGEKGGKMIDAKRYIECSAFNMDGIHEVFAAAAHLVCVTDEIADPEVPLRSLDYLGEITQSYSVV